MSVATKNRIITDLSQLDLSKQYSYADYLKWRLKERIELIKGFIYKMSPAPNVKHQVASRNLTRSFSNYFYKQTCQVFSAPFDVRLNSSTSDSETFTVVQPDLCVICDPNKLDEHGCVGTPDLIIEILSPGNTTKEMNTKFELYEENGVKEYWLVEPNDKAVFVYTLLDGKYIGLKPFSEENEISGPLFPDLKFPVSEIFV
jgi:Uma2 family endonuclease